MDLLEFGHAGAAILAFPTSKGSFFEWEDRGMIDALRYQLEDGWFRLICVDSVDTESWYADWKHPGARVWRHVEYDRYLISEVLPFIHSRSTNTFVICAGASFGAYHALNFGMRYPQHVQRILAMSGLCDIKMSRTGFTTNTFISTTQVISSQTNPMTAASIIFVNKISFSLLARTTN